jgi:hypothetical protein
LQVETTNRHWKAVDKMNDYEMYVLRTQNQPVYRPICICHTKSGVLSQHRKKNTSKDVRVKVKCQLNSVVSLHVLKLNGYRKMLKVPVLEKFVIHVLYHIYSNKKLQTSKLENNIEYHFKTYSLSNTYYYKEERRKY